MCVYTHVLSKKPTRVWFTPRVSHLYNTYGPFKLWVICTVCSWVDVQGHPDSYFVGNAHKGIGKGFTIGFELYPPDKKICNIESGVSLNYVTESL